MKKTQKNEEDEREGRDAYLTVSGKKLAVTIENIQGIESRLANV